MMVRVIIPSSYAHPKPIKARYYSDDISPCPPHIDENNREGIIDIEDLQPIFNSNYYCKSKIKLEAEETMVFNISTLEDVRKSRSPQMVSPLTFVHDRMTTNYRGNITQTLHPYTQSTGYLQIVQTEFEHIRRLTMSYKRHSCGGNFGTPNGFKAKQPEVNDINYGAIMCLWSLSKPFYAGRSDSEYRLVGNFTFSDSCDREFIMIKERRWLGDAVKKLCRDNAETLDDYIVKNSLTYISYQSENYNPQKTQFSIETKESIVCGTENKVALSTVTVQVNKETYRNNEECSWIFYTLPGYYLQVIFFGRFFIEASTNCTKDYLEVQHEEDGLWISDGRYCGRENPPMYNASSTRVQVIFRTNENFTAGGFSFFLRHHCSVTFNVTTSVQTIVSPNIMGYRNQRLHCEYTFVASESDKLINVRTRYGPGTPFYGGVTSVGSANCRNGFTTFKRDAFGTEKAGEQHCESEFEERAYGYLRLVYHSFSMIRYTIEYSLDTCGGNITESSSTIRPLKHESPNQYADNMNCIWYVTAPPDHSIAVRFKYFDTEAKYDHVSIYSGNVIQSAKRVQMLTGNLTDNPPLVLVDHNQAVINSISDASNSAKGFEAQIVFISNCNERISLTEGNSPAHVARNFKLQPGEENMCLYRLSAPEGYRIRLDIKQLQINNETSRCSQSARECSKGVCNTVEILDSVAMSQASMGQFCTGTNITLISSYEDAVMKFSATKSGQYSFEIVLTLEKSVCGPMTEYTLEKLEVRLLFKYYPYEE